MSKVKCTGVSWSLQRCKRDLTSRPR